MNFKIAAHTDIGIKKSTNQDSVLVKAAQTDYGKVMLAVVCDGMGGERSGQDASRIAIEEFFNRFSEGFEPKLDTISVRQLMARQVHTY